MYFFKDTNGNWIIGASVDTIVSKVPCILRRLSPTSVEIKTIKNGTLLIPVLEVTAIKKNAEGDFYANYAEFVASVSEFFEKKESIIMPTYGSMIDLIGLGPLPSKTDIMVLADEQNNPGKKSMYTVWPDGTIFYHLLTKDINDL